jgi:N-carbamoylputrescine amidase
MTSSTATSPSRSSERCVTLGLLQHAAGPETPREEVFDRVRELAREAVSKGAEILCTQELFAGSYFCQEEDAERMDLAEPIPGETTAFLAGLAREHAVEIAGSLFERREAGVYHNTSVYLDATGAIVGRYRKMHIPDDPRFLEKFYFTPGDLGWQVVEGRAKAGLLVCWDQWYPEAARLTALKGAEILIYPTAIGWWHGETPEDRVQQREAWKVMHRAHAIANGVFVAAINRVGIEDDLEFWGTSLVCDPGGEVIAEASASDPTALVVPCDLGRIEELRRGWPFLRDRRIDAYGGLTKRLLDDAAS